MASSASSDSDAVNISVDITASLKAETHLNDSYYSCAAIDSDTPIPDAHTLLAADSIPWCADSGCTTHVSPVRSDFTDMTSTTRRSKHVGGQYLPASGVVGTIYLCCASGQTLTLTNVLYVPDASLCLISIGRLDDTGSDVCFRDGHCTITGRNGSVIAQGNKIGTC
jgi:Pol polyprotein, beta-barrel domain